MDKGKSIDEKDAEGIDKVHADDIVTHAHIVPWGRVKI